MSTTIKIYNQKAETVGDLKLSDKVFGVETNEALVHQAMVAQMGNERQVLAHTKDRSEVRGGGKKPWAQKGTGRARAGSSRSPIWKGGGVTFGPRSERNFKKDINKKMKRKALCMVLSDKAKESALMVLDKFEIKEFKTKTADLMLEKLEKKISKDKNNKAKRSILAINDKKDEKAKYSFRNIVGVKLINLDNINILDLLKYRDLLISKDCVKKIEEAYK
ncbi:50S ribosomal protein L4 [Candidatus Parcubacteria bacterium]|nr:50S ribosomal protein L4 [Candidatus Parcubacteria bacterium]